MAVSSPILIVHRVDLLPAICDRTTADDPTTTFDVFKVARRDPNDPTRMTAAQPSTVVPSTRAGWHDGSIL